MRRRLLMTNSFQPAAVADKFPFGTDSSSSCVIHRSYSELLYGVCKRVVLYLATAPNLHIDMNTTLRQLVIHPLFFNIHNVFQENALLILILRF